MNYLSHGRDHVDEPYALAGTALPDWLRVLSRRARLRAGLLPATGDSDRSPEAQLGRGVRAHLEDDRWFHASEAFERVSADVTDEIRRRYPGPFGAPRPRFIRASFYGHIVPELLLDAALMEQRPDFVDRYYASLAQVDAGRVVAFVADRLGRAPARLDKLIDDFRRLPFLRTYVDDAALTRRLGEVTRRVGLPPLPDGFAALVGWARVLVRENAHALLTPEAPGDR